MAASFKFPIGFIIPITISIAKHIKSAGVKNLPIISTTFDGLIVSNNVSTKKIIETISLAIGVSNPSIGAIPIS